MGNLVIALEAGAKGRVQSVETPSLNCYNLEADHVVTEAGVFDNAYRVKQDEGLVTVTREGLPICHVRFNQTTGEWAVEFFMDEQEPILLAVNVDYFKDLRSYLASLDLTQLKPTRIKEGRKVLPFYCLYLPLGLTLVSCSDRSTVVGIFDEGVQHPEADYRIYFEDANANVLIPQQALVIKGEGADPFVRVGSLYQVLNYLRIQTEGGDPYWTFGDITAVTVEGLKAKRRARVELERNNFDQPKVWGTNLFTLGEVI